MVKSIAEAGSYHVTTIPPWPVGPRVSKVHPKASSTDVEMHPSKAAFVNGWRVQLQVIPYDFTVIVLIYISISTPSCSSCKFPSQNHISTMNDSDVTFHIFFGTSCNCSRPHPRYSTCRGVLKIRVRCRGTNDVKWDVKHLWCLWHLRCLQTWTHANTRRHQTLQI